MTFFLLIVETRREELSNDEQRLSTTSIFYEDGYIIKMILRTLRSLELTG